MAAPGHVVAAIRLRRHFMQRVPRRRKKLPRQQPPNAIIIIFRRALLTLLGDAKALVHALLLPELPSILQEAQAGRGDSMRMDAPGKRVKAVMEQVRKEFEEKHPVWQLEELAAQMGERTSDFQRTQFQQQLRAAIGVDVIGSEPKVQAQVDNFVHASVAYIEDLPDKVLNEVEQRTQAAVLGGLRHEELAQDIEERFLVGEDRAELIARDQTLSFYGNLNEVRQTALGIEGYTWRTALDERVRDEHAEREGEHFDWDDPPEDGHPGQPINCRCYAEPDVEALLEQL